MLARIRHGVGRHCSAWPPVHHEEIPLVRMPIKALHAPALPISPCYQYCRFLERGYSSLKTNRRLSANPASSWSISPNSCWTCRRDISPVCRYLPFCEDRALPSGVLGPVERSHGRCFRAVCRSFSRPALVSPFRFARLCRPAATRRGFGTAFGPLDIVVSLRWLSVRRSWPFSSRWSMVSSRWSTVSFR